MSDDDVLGGLSLHGEDHGPAAGQVDMPLDFEAFYLVNQEFFHLYAEIHLGSRAVAEETVHQTFLQILGNWDRLLQEGDLEQQTLAALTRHVRGQLLRDKRRPAFINGPIADKLRTIRGELELSDSPAGLYEAMLELSSKQFNVIVLRHMLGYTTARIARVMGLDPRTVDYHGRKAKERLRNLLGLPATQPTTTGRKEEAQ
ncbi:sigma-70 family RNA polymerase sigma factor [Streptomyces sp. ISL-43]|uniref:sigma-70 family RNA polymerase sigma factor n=1 Tax=Streptomyces sp. ISL-43 TaxID=2819183 RepID=UPI001BE9FD01|nr:sigma-70 family RNA polymerase sigma factor [Streptomyces sp. ISL-43]MBT2450781.1 sigma-70 family RNA polymerase sigma factor [Streptomyces sp. ISL-43]